MRTPFRLLAALVTALLVAGCGATNGDVAATVNGTDISRDLLEDSVLAMASSSEGELTDEQRQAEVDAFQRELLGFLIQDVIYAGVLDDEGISLSDEDMAAARAEQVEVLGGEDQLEEQLAGYGVPLEVFEMLVRLESRNAALQEHMLDDQEARGVRHILVETEDEAQDVISELDDGADFGELAAERSQDPGSAQNGGAYPPAPRGAWVAEFEQAVWEAELNEIVGPVETVHGFHVIEVTEETELDPSEMEPQQLQQLTQEAVGALLQDAFASAEVTVAGGLGEWDAGTGRVVDDSSEVGQAPDGSELPPQE